MEITEVRIKLMEESSERLKAFCSITFDDSFAIRDLKIIEGASGPFVAMPSRKLTAHCPNCRSKNHLRAAFCNQCGARLQESQTLRDDEGRAKLYADIAHPINSTCREMIQQRVIVAFEEEKKRSELPGYVPSYDDFDVDEHVVEATEPRAIRIDGAASTPSGPIQPARPEPADIQAVEAPRGPHRAPAQQPQGRDGPAKSFGAGVFE